MYCYNIFVLCKVYRLLTRKTYEMHLFHIASMKLGLDYALMHNLRSQYGEKAVTKKRMEEADGERGGGSQVGALCPCAFL